MLSSSVVSHSHWALMYEDSKEQGIEGRKNKRSIDSIELTLHPTLDSKRGDIARLVDLAVVHVHLICTTSYVSHVVHLPAPRINRAKSSATSISELTTQHLSYHSQHNTYHIICHIYLYIYIYIAYIYIYIIYLSILLCQCSLPSPILLRRSWGQLEQEALQDRKSVV